MYSVSTPALTPTMPVPASIEGGLTHTTSVASNPLNAKLCSDVVLALTLEGVNDVEYHAILVRVVPVDETEIPSRNVLIPLNDCATVLTSPAIVLVAKPMNRYRGAILPKLMG